ncbi:MAG: hypothetical protein RLZ10_2990 [Bacteroidota bacterium]|jgi:hypothetical protein
MNKFRQHLKISFSLPIYQVIYISIIGFALIFFYRPLSELDFFWRILIGNSYLQEIKPESYGLLTWSSENNFGDWVTTQPLGEILLFLLFRFGGLELVSVVRLFLWCVIVFCIFLTLLRKDRFLFLKFRYKFCLFNIASLGSLLVIPFIQERPQTFVLMILAVIGPLIFRAPRGWTKNERVLIFVLVAISVFIHPSWLVLYALLCVSYLKCLLPRKPFSFREWIYNIKTQFRIHDIPLVLFIPVLPIFGPSGFNYYHNIGSISRAGSKFYSEWQPLWRFEGRNLLLVLYFLFCLLYLVLINIKRLRRIQHLFITVSSLSLLLFPFLSARLLPFSILCSIIYLNTLLSSILIDDLELSSSAKDLLHLSRPSVAVSLICLIPILFFCLSLSNALRITSNATEDYISKNPIRIIESMRTLGSSLVINGPNEGALIHYFGGQDVVPLFDGRSDRYKSGAIKEIAKIMSSNAQGNDLVKTEEFDVATDILIPQSSLFRPSPETGFRFVCQENGYLWFTRKISAKCLTSHDLPATFKGGL